MELETKVVEKRRYSDVLASRYASTPLVNLWSAENKVVLERQLWVAALKAQSDSGLDIPKAGIEAYERCILSVNLKSIRERELRILQDVKARIEEFNALAGFELIHGGFTSRDQTDNVEQLQIRDSLLHVRDRSVAVLAHLRTKSVEFVLLDLCGRSHNVPGQTITLGKRIANWAEELLIAFERLEHLISVYPLRGIKGAMGTQQDMADLLGSPEKALAFENRIRQELGFGSVLDCVGQVYPRSLDFEVVSTLAQLGSACGNFAKMIRLMAGHELLHEGFREGQTASSAMPHKINSRTCERINGLLNVLCGFQDMTSRLLGDQWNEGDVSCSVVRRVALPGAFFALDGIYESALTVLAQMQVFPEMIRQELGRYLPFLSTTRLLMAAVKKGMGRETAHGIIKQHAVVAIAGIRQGGGNTFLQRLAEDSGFPFTREEIQEHIQSPERGLSEMQVQKVGRRISAVMEAYPAAVQYKPEPIL
ncbi:MAG: adenylosuccinate lyase [bacterium]|nr:adenylosuccinate lyase [bacterium]